MIVAPLLILTAFLESPFKPDAPAQQVAEPVPAATALCDAKQRSRGEKAERAASSAKPVNGLPESYGRSFRSLEGYLVHLQCLAAPVDAPWWLEVSPGVYRHMKTATNAVPEVATRAELMRRFGFSR
jgi:hypothetical protein